MKNNMLKVVLSTVVSSAIVLLGTSKIAASYFDLMAMGVSYLAVAILVALALADSRSNVKDYAGR